MFVFDSQRRRAHSFTRPTHGIESTGRSRLFLGRGPALLRAVVVYLRTPKLGSTWKSIIESETHAALLAHALQLAQYDDRARGVRLGPAFQSCASRWNNEARTDARW